MSETNAPPTTEWASFGVDLPAPVVAILKAAGAHDPNQGGVPYAMAAIVGALPWIMAALHRALPPADYALVLRQLHANLGEAWTIASADDPQAALDAAIAAARRGVN